MKKLKLFIVAAIAVLTTAMVVAFSGCGAAGISGLYYQDGHNGTGESESYRLELYDDGTYQMLYMQEWDMGDALTLAYGRLVTSYGTYDVTAEDTELQEKTVHLNMPDRMQLVAYHRQSINVAVDTALWPEGDEANGVAPGFSYTLMERAETEVWENAEDFIAAYGREYDVVCSDTDNSAVVTVNGEQIPVTAAVTPAA